MTGFTILIYLADPDSRTHRRDPCQVVPTGTLPLLVVGNNGCRPRNKRLGDRGTERQAPHLSPGLHSVQPSEKTHLRFMILAAMDDRSLRSPQPLAPSHVSSLKLNLYSSKLDASSPAS